MVNKAAATLRAQLAEQDSILVCPGVQDGLSARVCLDEGFKNLYMVSPPPSLPLILPTHQKNTN